MKLYLGGYLDFYHPEKKNRLEVEMDQPTSLREVLESIGIPVGDVHLFVVNDEIVELEGTIVSNQDEVKLFSAVGGG
ncbi:MAG: MoaD/ThiS family protein [Anaerolineales bacterium]|jgi:sulfur carrier protein ThiS|nr:MoaD/ThiS family protein [Anaerolineales bacterium]